VEKYVQKPLDKWSGILYLNARDHSVAVAQWIERFPAEEEVGGSNPLSNAVVVSLLKLTTFFFVGVNFLLVIPISAMYTRH
jgi:hypothetical protein